MFRNFSEALGAWSGWVIDQAAKEVIVRSRGGSDRYAYDRRMERFQTAPGTGTGAPCVVGVSPFDPIKDTELLDPTRTYYNNIRIKNATTGFYLGIGTQTARNASNALIFRMNYRPQTNDGITYGVIDLKDISGIVQYYLSYDGLTTNRYDTILTPYIKRNTDNTFTIANNNTFGLSLEPAPNNKVRLANIGMTYVFTKIACGQGHIIGLANGKLYAWGSNEFGQLGIGERPTTTMYETPTEVSGNLTNITEIACGPNVSAVISNKLIYTWGQGTNNQLGLNSVSNVNIPTHIVSLTNCIAISCGESHMVAIADNTVYTWGTNTRGQLGNGTTTTRPVPTAIISLQNPIAVACGPNHSFAIAKNGPNNRTLFGWGQNNFTQLGFTTTNSQDQLTPRTIDPSFTLKDVIRVAGGGQGGMAVSADGKLYQWGGQHSIIRTPNEVVLANSQKLTNVSGISCGYHNLAVSNGKIYAWGTINQYGQLGYDNNNKSYTAIEISGNLTNIQQIVAYGETSFAIANNKLYAWGRPPYNSSERLRIYRTTAGSMNVPFFISGPSGETTIDSRWIFEIPDSPNKCREPLQMTVENIAESFIEFTSPLSPLIKSDGTPITIRINNKDILSYNSSVNANLNYSRYLLCETIEGNDIQNYIIPRNINTLDTNSRITGSNLMNILGVKQLSQLSTIKLDIVQRNVVLFTGTFTRTPPIEFPPALPNGYTLLQTYDKKYYCMNNAATSSSTPSKIEYTNDINKADHIVFTVNSNTDLPNTKNLSMNFKDPVKKNINIVTTSPYTGFTGNLVNYIVESSITKVTYNSSPINLYFVPVRDSSGAYSFYLIPKNGLSGIFILQTTTEISGGGAIPKGSIIFQGLTFKWYSFTSPYRAGAPWNTDEYLSNFTRFIQRIFPNNEHKFWLSDRCDTVSCSNKQASLTASYLPWNSASLAECANCAPPTSYDPCSASGPCQAEKDRRTASRLKWSSSDIPECKACGSMLPNSYDPCNSASCTAAKRQAASSFQPYSESTFPECADCPADTGGLPGVYDPCSASGDCKTEQDRRTASNIKWTGSEIQACQACGTLKANSFDPCKSAQCSLAKDTLFKAKQPYNSASLAECNYCPPNTGSSPDSYDPCSASGECKTEQDRRTASNIKWSGSEINACQACGTLKANSFDPCKSAQCSLAKDALFKAKQPYNSASLAECNYCPSNTGSAPDSYDPCSASGECETEQTRRTASNIKWTGSDIQACQACGTLKANSFDPCKSAQCSLAKDALFKAKQPYNSASLAECNYCPPNTGSSPDSYDPCSASGECKAEQDRRTASNIKWTGSDIQACQACGTLKANSFDPCKSEQCATKKKSLMDIFMPWTQAKLSPECDYCPPGTGSLPDSYTPCGPNGQCEAAQKSRTASGRPWIGSQIDECRNCGSDQTSASWSPPPPPPVPAPASIPQQPASASLAPVTRSAQPMVYPVVYTDGRRINPSDAEQICRTVGGPTQSRVATTAQINAATTATRKWCHDTIDSTVAKGGTYGKTVNQTTYCDTAYKTVAKDSTRKPIYKDVICYGNRLPIGTIVPSPAGDLRVSAMEGKDTFVGSRETFVGSQYTPAMTRGTMTSGGVSAGRIPLMPADIQGSTPTIGQGRAATVGYSTFTPRR